MILHTSRILFKELRPTYSINTIVLFLAPLKPKATSSFKFDVH